VRWVTISVVFSVLTHWVLLTFIARPILPLELWLPVHVNTNPVAHV